MSIRSGIRCMRPTAMLIAAAGTSLHVGAALGTPPNLYWTDLGEGSIRRAALDGSGVEVILAGLSAPQGIAVDPVEGRVYWADSALQRISRANLDGTNIESFIDGAGAFTPIGLSIDAINRAIYWTDPVLGRVQRAGLESPVPESFQVGRASPQDVCVDPNLGRVYWTEGPLGVFYAPVSGGSPLALLDSFTGSVAVVAQNPFPCQIVWRAANRLSRADCLGIGVQNLLQSPGDVVGIAIDQGSSTIFWTDSSAGCIRVLGDGDGVSQTLITGLAMPWRLTIGPSAAPPVIVAQPVCQAVSNSEVAVLSVEATGTQPLSYAWLRDGVLLSDDAHLSGSTSAQLTVVASHADAGLYHCVVSNTDGVTATSPAALAVRFCDSGGAAPASASPQGPLCTADLDADCDVDVSDFSQFIALFGTTVSAGGTGDLNCDGVVSVFDFSVFSEQFGCGQGSGGGLQNE